MLMLYILTLQKHFYKVNHEILCHKLKQLGIGGQVGTWIHNFLIDRTQSITANGQLCPRLLVT